MHATIRNWREMTPQEVLDSFPALTVGQIAYVISAYKRDGDLDRRYVIKLIHDGRLALIDPDPTLSTPRWTVSQANVRSYLGADIRVAS